MQRAIEGIFCASAGVSAARDLGDADALGGELIGFLGRHDDPLAGQVGLTLGPFRCDDICAPLTADRTGADAAVLGTIAAGLSVVTGTVGTTGWRRARSAIAGAGLTGLSIIAASIAAAFTLAVIGVAMQASRTIRV